MAGDKFRLRVEEQLAAADIRINGSRPWDMTVRNDHLYARVLAEGSLGLGEAYMEGWWESGELDQFFARLLGADLRGGIRPWKDMFRVVQARVVNRQSRARAFQVGRVHYDVGNDLYQKMLDPRMIYSCGYWQDAACLEEAQTAKLDLICQKLGVQPGMKVLDVGCGWGGTARYLAEKCGAKVVGITISRQQAELAKEMCAGLEVDIRLQDYRSLNDKFDRIVSVGMFEHVGYKNYPLFMQVVRRNLRDDGLFLLQTIGGNRTVVKVDSWFDRYIFPNSMLPSTGQMGKAIEGHFIMEDWHSFGADYDATLMAWARNFEAAWPELRHRYSEQFYRMWRYYLLSCAGAFRARQNQLWQIVLSPNGVPGGHRPARGTFSRSSSSGPSDDTFPDRPGR